MSITVQALGRPSYLGQLYNATTSSLIPGFRLFNDKEVKPIKTTVSSTDIKYEEVKSVKDKASTLNISAELSVSILSGSVDVTGMGSYLKTDSESTDSTTVVAVGQFRTYNESLDVNQLLSSQAMTVEQLAKTGATHVVTSITYGGNIVGSLTQKQDLSSSKMDVKGKFSLDVFKGLGKAIGTSGGGKAELTVDEQKKLNSFNLNVKLAADFFSKGDEVPANAVDLLKTFKKSPNLIGDGVPCDVTLTPLSWLQSGIPSFRELADADILELTNLYDEVIMLGQHRSALSIDVGEYKSMFPTFLDKCRKSNLRVSHLVQKARGDLRTYLQKARSGGSDVKSPYEFLESIEPGFEEERTLFEEDYEKWLGLMERVRAAKQHGFPPVSISELRGVMTRQVKGTIAIILVPEDLEFSKLLATYRELADDIRKWRSTVDGGKPKDDGGDAEGDAVVESENDDEFSKLQRDIRKASSALRFTQEATQEMVGQMLSSVVGGDSVDDDEMAGDAETELTGNETKYVSVYADARLDKDLLKLDDETKSVADALKTAREEHKPVFLTYGLTRSTLVQLRWSVLNQEGWGVLVNEEESWRYIGDVHKGVPHGVGVITYADGSVYKGDWFRGKRDGSGELFPPQEGAVGEVLKDGVKGVYVENVLVNDGVVVKVTVYRGGSPIQFGRVALRTGDAAITHVDKIGRVLSWKLGKKYRLKVGQKLEILVNGTKIDPSENDSRQSESWPLEGPGEKSITAKAL